MLASLEDQNDRNVGELVRLLARAVADLATLTFEVEALRRDLTAVSLRLDTVRRECAHRMEVS